MWILAAGALKSFNTKRPSWSGSPTVIKYQFQTFSTTNFLTYHNRLFRGATPDDTCYVTFYIMTSFLFQRLYSQRCLRLLCLAQEHRSLFFLKNKITILLSNIWQKHTKRFFYTRDICFPRSICWQIRAETEVQISRRRWKKEAFQHCLRKYFPLHSLSPLAYFVISTLSNRSN